MNKYLLEILQETNTIIIPGLGAITVTNKDKGEMMFMSYLKHDDGALSSYISEKDGVDETEAKNTIAKYVREIQAKLDQGESFDVFGLGSFVKDKDGDIEFVGKADSETHEPSVVEKEEAIIEQTIVETIAEVEQKETPHIEPETSAEEIVIPAEEPIAEPEVSQKKHNETVEVTEESPKKEETEFIEQPLIAQKELNISEKQELSKNVEKFEKLKEKAPQVISPTSVNPRKETNQASAKKDSKKSVEPKKEKKKRGAGFWILIALLFLIVGGGTYFGLNYNEFKQYIPFLADAKETPAKESDAKKKMEELMGETETTSEPEEEMSTPESETPEEEVTAPEEPKKEEVQPTPPPKKPTPSSSTSGGAYKIICGVFSDPANAERMLSQLKSEGLPAEILPSPSGMSFVSMKAFGTEAEATAALSSMRSIAPKAWLMKVP